MQIQSDIQNAETDTPQMKKFQGMKNKRRKFHKRIDQLETTFGNIIKNPFGEMATGQVTQQFISMSQYNINRLADKVNILVDERKYFFRKALKQFFDIDNAYVLKKLRLVLFPFFTRGEWQVSENFIEGESLFAPQNKFQRQDVQSPDLYIPFMSLITYVLIIGFSNGVGDSFEPDLIGKIFTYCIVLTLLEVVLTYLCFKLQQFKKGTFLEILALTQYKYVGMCLIVLADIILGGYFTLAIRIYVSLTFFLFLWKSLKRFSLDSQFDNSFEKVEITQQKQRIFMIIAGAQVLWIYLIVKFTL